jgi:hypothetical protein
LTERTCWRLRSSGASFILPDYHDIAFLKISGDDLGYPAVSDSCSDEPWLDLLRGGQNPDGLPLPSLTASTLAASGKLCPALAAARSLSSLAALAPLPLTITAGLAAFSSGRLTLAAFRFSSPATLASLGSTLTPGLAVEVTRAALGALAPGLSVEVAAAAFAPLMTLVVAVALSGFSTLSPSLAVEVAAAAFASLTEALVVSVSLSALASLMRIVTAAPMTAFIGVALVAAGCWLLSLLFLPRARLLSLLTLALRFELFSALFHFYAKRFLLLFGKVGSESQRGIGYGKHNFNALLATSITAL